MKRLNLVTLLFALLIALPGFAQDTYKVSGCDASISGTSSVHDWESEVDESSGTATIAMSEDGTVDVQALTVTFKVESIKSGKSLMDKKTYEALKSDKHPNITFKLASVKSYVKTGDGFTLTGTGTLTMAGVSKTVSIPVKGKISTDGKITFSGSKSLKMSDYSMEPPTAMMGAIKTGDEVTVKFSSTFKK